MIYSWKPDKSSSVALHAQVASFIRSLINTGTIAPDERIAGERKLAAVFDVSRTTIINAFESLLNEGLIVAHPRSGFTVAPVRHREGYMADWGEYIKRAKYRPGRLEYKRWGGVGGLLNFAVLNEFELVPEDLTLTLPKRHNLKDFSKYGYEPLRETLLKHLATAGVITTASNILIAPSVTAACNAIYAAFTGPGSNFIYEKPNLINTVSNIHSIGLNMIDIPVDEYGLSSKELLRVAAKRNLPFLHLDPCDHCPTGVVMTKTRRAEIMQIVRTYKIPVVEIDHMRDAWFQKPFPPPLKSFEGGQNVFYLGSFIRKYPVDMRISWIVADRQVIEHLSNVFVQMDVRPSAILQMMAKKSIESGSYYKAMEEVRAFIKGRREMALALCEKHLKGIAVWVEKNCGFHFWLEFPEHNTKHIFTRGDISSCYPGYFFDRDDTSHILLCPASIPESEVKSTIEALGKKFRR